MTLLITYIVVALLASFLCSILEAALLSITPSFIAVKEQEGSRMGKRLKMLKDDIDRPLAAILSLNTIAHTLGAAGAGAQAVKLYGDAYLGLITVLLTLAILIFSEIIPKTLGALYWRQLAGFTTHAIRPMIWAMWPLVKLSQFLTAIMARGRTITSVSREEMTALADLGHREGVFEADESRILKNLFRFGSLRVRDVMTPRTVMFALHADRTIRDIIQDHQEFRFSRIPIYRNSRDDVSGYVLKDEILLRAAQEDLDLTLEDIKREMIVVPDVMRLSDLFERLLDDGEHIALVVDEYGGVEGLVTMEDAVETLLGLEIMDEVDSEEDMQALARRQWLRRAQRLGIVTEGLNDVEETDLSHRPDRPSSD